MRPRPAALAVALVLALPAGARAEEAAPAPGSRLALFAPPLRRGLTRAHGTMRPFFNLIGQGGGAVADLSVEHYFQAPLSLALELAPLALAIKPDAVGAITHARVAAAYATDYLELGAGVGFRSQNYGAGGLSLAARLRLGALDGARLLVSYGYVVFRNHYTGKTSLGFSNVVTEARVPLFSRLAVIAEGAVSLDVWIYATLGLEHRLVGDGGPGTWLLRGGFGLAWVLDRFACEYRDPAPCEGVAWALGPTISFGLERRF